jgi:hypothetical protein
MKRVMILAVLLGGTVGVRAEEITGSIDYGTIRPYVYDLQLADNTLPENPAPVTPAPADTKAAPAPDEVFHESLFTRNKLHKYLGLGSLGLATLALLAPKQQHAPHEYFAKGAAALGGAAVASGLVIHWDDINPSYGLHDPDNVHALLATAGAAGFLVAVHKAPQEGHAAAGAMGYAAMLIGIHFVW